MNKTIVTQQTKTASFLPPVQGILQRKCACGNHTPAGAECTEREKEGGTSLQRSAVSNQPMNGVPLIVHDVLNSTGQSLDTESRTFVELRFDHDFSQVRLHTDAPTTIRTKLTFSKPGDKYEQEADRVAARVMSSQPTSDGFKESATSVSSNQSRARSNLDRDTKSFMEARFAANFDQVRVHTGRQATKASVALGARAFAMGPDICFASGEYRPHTSSGRLLLAHELTHVVQQGHAAPMVQRKETGTSNDLTNQTSTIPTGDNITTVVDESERGTRRAIMDLEKALNEADAALAEKRFPEDKLARIRVQADKLRPMLEAYRKVERGEQPDPGLTLDFNPKRDQIDEGDADLLASGELEDSGSASTAFPQVFASRAEHGLVSLRVEGVDVQRAICGGLCIAGAIALGALLLSGCTKKQTKSKKRAGVDSFKVKWTKPAAAGAANAKLRLDYNAKFKKDANHDPALAEFRQSVMSTWDVTAGPHKARKGTTAPMHDDNYSRADDLAGNKITDVKFYSADIPGYDDLHANDVLDYSFTAEQTIIDTSLANKEIAKRGPHTATIKGKHPRTYTGLPKTLS